MRSSNRVGSIKHLRAQEIKAERVSNEALQARNTCSLIVCKLLKVKW